MPPNQLTSLLITLLAIQLAPASIISTLSSKLSEDTNRPDIWALIAVGSNGWVNYRHQAGACHAFHVLKNHGVPEERIILMMYDDIAYHKENPSPGKIINRPRGPNVYEGVKVDYNGSDVTPDNFLAVLRGDSNAVNGGTGRVIKSTPDDHIFVFYVDHGGTGLIEFPDAILTVKDLNDALHSMYRKKQYNQMVFYVEACESGSMFKNTLPKNINVYAVTSANEKESAWGCYCDGVGPRMPCLGDVFSVSWMENADVTDLKSEKLKAQVEVAREAATMSHVMEYGNVSISNETVANFQGWKQSSSALGVFGDAKQRLSMMPVREIPIMMLRKKLKTLKRTFEKIQLRSRIKNMMKKRGYLKKFFSRLISDLVPSRSRRKHLMADHPDELSNLHCFDDVVKAFHTACFNFSENRYALKYSYVLANLCESGIPTERILEKMMARCLDIEVRDIH